MAHPGQYPGRPAQPQLREEEFKEILCQGCASPWRRPVAFFVQLQHRFKASLRGQKQIEWAICLGCGEVLDPEGAVITAKLPSEVQREVKRA